MPHDASSELVKSSLDALSSIGEVSVTMIGPDSQVSYLGGYVHFGSWYIASSCGWWSRLDWDRYQCLWPKLLLAFYVLWWAWFGSIVVPDTPDLSTLIPELKQGIPYYVRICASNAMGSSPFVTPYPQFQIPYQHQPAPPLEVSCLASKDGSTLLAVIIGAPFHDGGKMCRPIESITAHSHLYRRDSVSHWHARQNQRFNLSRLLLQILTKFSTLY